MSRIGKLPVDIKDLEVNVQGTHLVVKGPKGVLELTYDASIKLEQKDGYLTLMKQVNTKQASAKHGMYRALVANMVRGVRDGFEKQLELVGVGYKVVLEGVDLVFSLGYSHPIKFPAPAGIKFELEGQTKVKVIGIDKQLVGQTAANIRELRLPEPYKGKGVKYIDEVIRKKQGKSVK